MLSTQQRPGILGDPSSFGVSGNSGISQNPKPVPGSYLLALFWNPKILFILCVSYHTQLINRFLLYPPLYCQRWKLSKGGYWASENQEVHASSELLNQEARH